jgi:hypothetical protein
MVFSGMLCRVALVRTRATRRNIPEDTILHSHRREDLKSYTNILIRTLQIMKCKTILQAMKVHVSI